MASATVLHNMSGSKNPFKVWHVSLLSLKYILSHWHIPVDHSISRCVSHL